MRPTQVETPRSTRARSGPAGTRPRLDCAQNRRGPSHAAEAQALRRSARRRARLLLRARFPDLGPDALRGFRARARAPARGARSLPLRATSSFASTPRSQSSDVVRANLRHMVVPCPGRRMPHLAQASPAPPRPFPPAPPHPAGAAPAGADGEERLLGRDPRRPTDRLRLSRDDLQPARVPFVLPPGRGRAPRAGGPGSAGVRRRAAADQVNWLTAHQMTCATLSTSWTALTGNPMSRALQRRLTAAAAADSSRRYASTAGT